MQMTQQVIGSAASESAQPAPARTPAATKIESVSFRGRTVSSLHRPADSKYYVLLEAVCRVFFPHQRNVNGFIRSAETLLNIPDVRMTDSEEQQFISFYKLPTDRLRHNKLIRLDLLAEIFPRLEVLFSTEVGPGEGQLIGTIISAHPSDSATTTDGRALQTTTTNDDKGNVKNDDAARPRKRRRNDVGDIVVIDWQAYDSAHKECSLAVNSASASCCFTQQTLYHRLT